MPCRGLVHRSPRIAGTGAKRLLFAQRPGFNIAGAASFLKSSPAGDNKSEDMEEA